MPYPSILLIISGSIAAYKTPELIRRLRERGAKVRCILTRGGEQFVTALTLAGVSGQAVYTDLFSLKDESEMGHIRLSREADMVVVAPASADILAKMAAGLADDLATAALLASDKKILIAPAMNAQMWAHPAVKRNLQQLAEDGVAIIEPGSGVLACGEVGAGRMAEVDNIIQAIFQQLAYSPPLEGGARGGVCPPTQPSLLKTASLFSSRNEPSRGEGLNGLTALVTSGPTHEAIDPVRFIANRSSGKQGHAIAAALARHGAQVTLISGPVALPDPEGVQTHHVVSAQEMASACEAALPVDVAICAAAVADWRVATPIAHKLKKNAGLPSLQLVENPDILHHIANHASKRPRLVIGFAAETSELQKNAAEKRARKQCDWLLANDVANGKGFDAEENQVTLISETSAEDWPLLTKSDIAERLVQRIITHFART